MDGLRRGGLAAAAVAAGLLLLVWASASGPVRLLSPTGRTRQRPTTPAEPTASATGGPAPTLEEQLRDVRPTADLSWLGDLVAWTVFLLGALGLYLLLRHLWRHRWRPPPKPATVQFDVLPDTGALAAAISTDVRGQLAAVDEGSPRNGIVGCWLRLEQVIADAGLPRRRAETSAEFTVRVLKTLDVDPRAIGTLAALYREARFSEHELTEPARTTARSALERLHQDLRELGLARPGPGSPG